MHFYAVGYIVRDPFVKPSMRVVVVRAKYKEAAVCFVMSKLCQFYKHFDVFIDEGYVEL